MTINQTAINRLVTDPRSPVYRQMDRTGAACSAVAKINAPVDDGHLRRTIDYELIARPPILTARIIAPVNYAKFVHEGHPEIRPKTKKALRWRSGGKFVFAKRVKAVAGRPFLVNAVEAVTGKRVRRTSG